MATEVLNLRISGDGRGARQATTTVTAGLQQMVKGALAFIGTQKLMAAGFRALQSVSLSNLVRQTVAAAAEVNELTKRARAIGTTAQDLEVAEGAVALLTDGTVIATRAFQDFQRSIAEARDGTEAQATAMAKLGISTEEFTGLGLVDQLALVARRFDALKDDAEATQVSMDLFGRSGRQIVAALRTGGDAIEDAAEQIRASGLVTDEMAAQSEKLTDSVFLLHRSLGVLKREALLPLAPAIAGAADWLAKMAQGMRGVGEDGETLGQQLRVVFMEQILPAVFTVGQTTSEVFQRMGIGFKFWEIQAKSALLGVQGTIDIYAAAVLRAVGATEQSDEVMDRVQAQAWVLRAAELELEDMQFALAHSTDAARASFEDLLEDIRRATDVTLPRFGTGGGGGALGGVEAGIRGLKSALDDITIEEDLSLVEKLLGGGFDASAILAAAANETERLNREFLAGAGLGEEWAAALEQVANVATDLVERLDPVVPAIDAQAEAWRRAQEEAAAYTTTLDYVQQGLGAVGDFARAIGDIVVAQHQRGSEAAKEAARSAFVVQQLVALAQATISMFVAIAQANASAPYPANIPAIVAAGVTGGIQIAGIAATTIAGVADAGLTPEQINRAVTGSHSTVVVQRGEAVIDRRGTSEISQMLGLQRERMAGGGGATRVQINAPVLLDGRQVGRFVDDHLVDTTERGRSYSTRVQPGTA